MDTMIIDISSRKFYRKFRKDIGRYLFIKRQNKNMSLKSAANCAKITTEQLDEIEIGKRSLKISSIIKLLGVYHIDLKISFTSKEDAEKRSPQIELM